MADNDTPLNLRLGGTKPVFSELSPASINISLALSGQPAPNLNKTFTYAELGAGYGLSIAGWAAQYPKGEFFSIDADAHRSTWTQRLADAAELSNLTVFERTFQQMLDAELPPLDYVVLHNTYTRVSDETAANLRAFLGKFLKPGGVVYIGYDALPGWSQAEPLRHMIQEGAKATGEKNALLALSQGLNFLKELDQSGALFFKATPNAGAWLDGWRQGQATFLVEELLNSVNRALNFSTVQSQMDEVKAAYIGSLDLTNYLESAITPTDFAKRLGQVGGNVTLRETVKDMLYNTVYRRDLFMKGPQALSKAKAKTALENVRLVLSGVRKPLPDEVILKGVKVTLKADVYDPILDALAEGPATIAKLAEKTGQDFAQVAQACVVSLTLGWCQPAAPEGKDRIARVKALNLALDDLLESEPFEFLLAADGAWQQCGFLERLYGLAMMKNEEAEMFIANHIKTYGLTLNQDGKPVTDEAATRKIISEQSAVLAEQLPPVLKRLGLID